MNLFSEFSISLAQTFILWYLIEYLFEDRGGRKYLKLAGYVFLCVLDMVCWMLPGSMPWHQLILVLAWFAFLVLVYRIGAGLGLLFAICFFAAKIVLFYATDRFFTALGIRMDLILSEDFGLLLAGTFVELFLLLGAQITLVAAGRVVRKNRLLQSFPLILVLVVGLIICGMNIYVQRWQNYDVYEASIENLLVLSIGIVVCAYIEIIKGYFESLGRARIAEHQLRMQKDFYRNVLNYQEETRMLWHDIGKYVAAVDALLDQNATEEAEQARRDMNEKIRSIDTVVDVNNQLINRILTYGLKKCRENRIDLVIDAWVSEQLNVSATNLFVIIGNTLDNAVEACMNLPADGREIKLSLVQRNHILVYQISNQMPEKPMRKKRAIHGYGLRNVASCVKNNGGTIRVTAEGGRFSVNIQLNV